LDGAALESPSGIEASLVSAYSVLDGWTNAGNAWGRDAGHWIWSGVVSDEAHKGSDASDIAEIAQLELFQWLPSNFLLDEFFQSRYEGIARVNATIALNNASEEISAARKSEIDAEAKFLRAHYHFDLYRVFKNIPYYTEEDFDFKKANDQDILPSVIADLQIAVNGLPVNQSEVGRATKGAAQAYLGKVYMFTGQFAEAKAQLSAVVSSGKYTLTDCYHDNFNAAKDNNSESIFAVQFSVNDGDPNAANGNVGTRLGFPGGGPFGCCGFNQPSQALVNAFKTDANGLPLMDGADVNANSFVDPRLDWTVGRDNVPYYDHGLHDPTWIRDRNNGGPYSPKKTQYHADQDQFNSSAAPGAWGPQISAINYYILRYADVLLMLAEAEVETGNLEAARALVNQVRRRAGGCAQGPGATSAEIEVPIGDPSITWAKYNVGEYTAAWTDATAARNAVRLERRIELAMEGHRMYDLRRWGTLEQTMNAYIAANNARPDTDPSKRRYLSQAFTVEAKHYAYPLPIVQVDLSVVDGQTMLKQNTGF
jgi:tetratricopeptide (TPR) repeat protein